MITLKRVFAGENGTFGVLMNDQRPLCVTLEPLWYDNQEDVSCIPAGKYQCKKHNGPRFEDSWEVLDVPGRTAILIHPGNTIGDTKGCILAGMRFMPMGVADSRQAIQKLRGVLPDHFELSIVDVISYN